MLKTILGVLLIISTISCATIREYRTEYKRELAAENARIAQSHKSSTIMDDNRLNLLLALYVLSLRHNSSYYKYSPNYLNYSLDPALWFYQYQIESSLKHQLWNYQFELEMINNIETSKLEMEVHRLIEELNRAKRK
jgi:hypothetical protein